MYELNFFLLLLSFIFFIGSCNCFVFTDRWQRHSHGRIVGGQATDIKKVPYQASLLFEGKYFCGGSLVSDKHVITAAHCIQFFLKGEENFSVRLGSNYTNRGGVVTKIKRTICHRDFNFDNYDYDICILELYDKLKFNNEIQSVRIALIEPLGGEFGVVAGWGTLSENGISPEELQSVSVAITNKTFCNDAYQVISPITERMICAGTEGKDSCQGDSGGGLVVEGNLMGISSTGFGCGVKNYPGVYTSVAHPEIRKFILNIIHF